MTIELPQEHKQKINEIQNPDKTFDEAAIHVESEILFKETGRTRTKYLERQPDRVEEFKVTMHNTLDDMCMISPHGDYEKALEHYKEINLD